MSEYFSRLMDACDLESQAKGIEKLILVATKEYGSSENPFLVVEVDDAKKRINLLKAKAKEVIADALEIKEREESQSKG